MHITLQNLHSQVINDNHYSVIQLHILTNIHTIYTYSFTQLHTFIHYTNIFSASFVVYWTLGDLLLFILQEQFLDHFNFLGESNIYKTKKKATSRGNWGQFIQNFYSFDKADASKCSLLFFTSNEHWTWWGAPSHFELMCLVVLK